MDKQILKALVYIKENPNCSVDDSENINDKIVHYLFKSHLVDATDSKTIHMQHDEYGYFSINITTQGEIKINDLKISGSLLNIFNNKVIRFVVATIFTAIVGVAAAIFVFNYKKSHEQSTQQEEVQQNLLNKKHGRSD